MPPTTSPYTFFTRALCLVCLLALAACAPTPGSTTEPRAVNPPATPTPEIFNPLHPSPTPADSLLPLTCQATDLGVSINEAWGYCFAFPASFTLEKSPDSGGAIHLYGPALGDSSETLRASLEITALLVPQGSGLAPLVNAYLSTFKELSGLITRETILLGGAPAEKLAPVPGLLNSQVVMSLRNDILYTLRFHPSDVEIAKPDFDALTQTVLGSFAYLEPSAPPSSQIQTVSWPEFGQNMSLSFDSLLAPWVEAATVPAVPTNDQMMFAELHPAYAQFRFTGYQGGRTYQLPLLPVENQTAQVMVFQTKDFPGYGDGEQHGFVRQAQVLAGLLDAGLQPDRCAQPLTEEAQELPLLPWVNSRQVFCAQPHMLAFANGRGLRYLTYYAQDPSPALDQRVFYTFQGLTADGQFYVSAFFPVQSDIFPSEAPPCPKCGQPDYNPFVEWSALLTGQVGLLNALPEENFTPALNMLDALIQSIQIGQ